MSDPVIAFILIAAFFAAVTLAHWFRTLDGGLWREAATPLIAGGISGVLLRFAGKPGSLFSIVATGVVFTAAALYTRLTGRESEPEDGMALGAMTGAAAAIPLVLAGESELMQLAACLLAGAIAGYGITFGLTHVRDAAKQFAIDAVTAVLAVGAAYLPILLLRGRMADRQQIAIGAAALVPLLLIVTVFKQWPAVRAELRHEAMLGVLDDEDVRPTAHPFLRLTRAGWHDAGAHREFVRSATKIALRKRRQRGRDEETARLYQLEVIKLRMQLQEMSRIDRAMRAHAARG